MFPRLALACTVLGAALGASPASAELKGFRDWMAACDNTRSCAAYAVKETPTGAFLRITREGAPAAAPRITVFVDVEKGKRFTLAFDDAAGGLPQGAIAAAPGDDDLTKVEIAAVDAFIAALRKATRIDVRIDPPAEEKPRISLDGAVAALLWIDEQQKRLGTVTALVRHGDKPASSMPVPPAAPVVNAAKPGTAAIPKTFPAAVSAKGKEICGEEDENPRPIEAQRLNGNLLFYLFECRDISGAYNAWNGAVVAPADRPQAARVIELPYPPGDQTKTRQLFVNGHLDPKTLALTTFNKGRGLGDCGMFGEWVWDGRAFRLTRYQTMPSCAGIRVEHWPVLYRATRR